MASDEFDNEPTDLFRTLDPEQALAVHGEVTGDDLLAAVLADPDSDEARSVYADYLLERGDPRGELIQLQLERHRSQRHDDVRWHRERELSANRIPEWCGPLFPALAPESIQFRRGFLWRCRTQDRTIALRDVVGHPLWRTVGDLESFDEMIVKHACVRSASILRTGPEALAALAAASHVSAAHTVVIQGIGPFRQYADSHWRESREERAWAAIHAVGALTNLRTLAITQPLDPLSPRIRELLRSPLGTQLDSLEYWIQRCSLERWFEVLPDYPTLRRVVVHTGRAVDFRRSDDRGGVVLERDAQGLKLKVEIDGHVRNHDAVETAASLASRFRRIEVVAVGGWLFDEDLRPMVGDLRERFEEVIVRNQDRP